jgi:hypothetical protein
MRKNEMCEEHFAEQAQLGKPVIHENSDSTVDVCFWPSERALEPKLGAIITWAESPESLLSSFNF